MGFDVLAGFLSSIFAGGATGLLGVAIQRYFDNKKLAHDLLVMKEKNLHDLNMKNADLAIMKEEWAGRVKVAQTEGETAKEVAATKAFEKSLFVAPERYSEARLLTPGQNWWFVILDWIRGVVQPALTVYLCALTSFVWWQVRLKLNVEELDPVAVLDVWKLVVQTILYLTTTVVLWWFGTQNRQSQPAIKL